MKSRVLPIVSIVLAWLLLGFAGYLISQLGVSWFGSRAMLIGACSVALIAIVMLLGQYLAGTADYFLSIDNPRPLDEHETTIISSIWGFARETSRSAKAEVAGEGFADIRLFATRIQMAKSLLSFGFMRPVSIVWRGNAGQRPLGDA